MGRNTQDYEFAGNLGLNRAISSNSLLSTYSPNQAVFQGAYVANNVYFQKYGAWSSINKRYGSAQINRIALDGGSPVVGIYPFQIGATKYLHSMTESGKLYDINISTGVSTLITSGFSTDLPSDSLLMAGKQILTAPNDTTYDYWLNLSSNAGWVMSGAYDTATWSGVGTTLVIDDSTAVRTGTGTFKKTDMAEIDATNKTLLFHLHMADSAGTAKDFTALATGAAIVITLYSDVAQTNGAQYAVNVDWKGRSLFSSSSNGAMEYYDDYVDIGHDTVRIALNLLATPYAVAGTGLNIASIKTVSFAVQQAVADDRAMLGDLLIISSISDLVYTEDGNGYARIFGENLFTAPTSIADFDGRCFVSQGNSIGWSAPLDPTEWTEDSSNMTIDDTDGDLIVGMKKLGNFLFVFKNYSIHKIAATGDYTIPYRRIQVYSSSYTDKGVGALNHRNIQRAILGAQAGQEGYGAQEYLVFNSNKGIYAISEYGKPTPIDGRVVSIVNSIPDGNVDKCFLCAHPRRDQIMLGYPASAVDYCSAQLMYGTESKEWSQYYFSKLRSGVSYRDTDYPYLIVGNEDGFLYKHDYQVESTTNASYFKDTSGSVINAMDDHTEWTGDGVSVLSTDAINTYGGLSTINLSRAVTVFASMIKSDIASIDLTVTNQLSFFIKASNLKSMGKLTVTLLSTAGNSVSYYITTLFLTNDAWCEISIDLTTAPSASVGTFDATNLTSVYISVEPGAATTVDLNVAFLNMILETSIDADYQTMYWDFGNGNNYKTLFSLDILTPNHSPSTTAYPISLSATNEIGDIVTATYEPTSTLDWNKSRIALGHYGKWFSLRFRNNVIEQSMSIYSFSAELKQHRSTS